MEESSNEEIVFSKNVIEFLTVANEYCLFVENADNYSKNDIINYLLKVCPLIYIKGSLLPEIEESDYEITERYVAEEHWEKVYQSIKNKLGKEDKYWILICNEAGENLPSMASIAENLADIYQDLKDFIMLYQKGTHASKENAIAECNMLFKTHWGTIIVNSHKALHNILYGEVIQNNFFENEN